MFNQAEGPFARGLSILYYLLSSVLYYDYTNTLFYLQICGISHSRGKEFRKYWPQIFDLEEDKYLYEWWRSRFLINGFNYSCKNIVASYMKVWDQSMRAIRFRTTLKGKLPHLYCFFCNTQPLGTKFKTMSCYGNGALMFVDIIIGKEGMNNSKCHLQIGETEACTDVMFGEKKEIGNRYMKEATKDYFSVSSPQRGWKKLRWVLGQTRLV